MLIMGYYDDLRRDIDVYTEKLLETYDQEAYAEARVVEPEK